MRKRGWLKSKSLYSVIIGILCLFIGLIPFAGFFGLNIIFPDFLLRAIVVKVLLVLGGIFLLVDSFNIGHGPTRFYSVLAGLILFLVGLVPILVDYNMLTFLPFIAVLKAPDNVLRGLLAFYGLYLVIDSFIMRKSTVGKMH